MKVRNGFVSNSSSSSFVLVVKQDVAKKTLDKINNDIVTAIVMSALSPIKLFGVDSYTYLGFYDNGGYSNWEDFNVNDEYAEKVEKFLEDNDCCYSELFDEFLEEMRKDNVRNVDYFQESIDF